MTIEFLPARNKTSASLFGPGKRWETPRLFKLVVIHWTAGSFNSCLRWFQAPNNKRSSAHYVISELGKIVQMVDEESVAWHAGISSWKDYPTYPASTNNIVNPWVVSETTDGEKIKHRKYYDWNSLNPCSIGIELAGPPSCIGLKGWNDEQIEALVELCRDIRIRMPDIKLIDHSRICATKIDVIKGTGYEEDIFPWDRLVDDTKMIEA